MRSAAFEEFAPRDFVGRDDPGAFGEGLSREITLMVVGAHFGDDTHTQHLGDAGHGAHELHLIVQVEGRNLGQQFRFTSGDALVDQVDVCQGLLQEREQVVRQYDQRAFLDLNAFGKVAVQGINLNGRAFLDDGLEKVKTEWGW